MKPIVLGLTAVALATLTSACGYSERTYAVQGPSTESAVAVPGAEHHGDRYYSGGYYVAPATTTTTYVRTY